MEVSGASIRGNGIFKAKKRRDSPAQDEDTMRQRETRAGRMGRGMSCWAVWIFIWCVVGARGDFQG